MDVIRTNSIGEFLLKLKKEERKHLHGVTLSMNNPYNVVVENIGIDYEKLRERFNDACTKDTLYPFVYELTRDGEAFMIGDYATVRFSRDAFFIINMNVTFGRKLTLKQALQHICLFAMLQQAMLNNICDSDRNTAMGHSVYYFDEIVMEKIPAEVEIKRVVL